MLRCVRLYPKMTFKERRAQCDTEMSNSHIKNLCREARLTHWRAKKRPKLTEEHAKIQYQWAQIRRYWDVTMWRRMMFSDECSVERGAGKKQIWVFGLPKNKWKPAMVETYKSNKNMKIMVWDMFWGSGRSSLYVMDRDFESKKFGYSANSYIEVLDAQLARHYTGDLWFVHDNAPIHTANKVKAWFKEQKIDVQDWAPYSPDMNPIEYVWKALKELVAEMYPEIMKNTSETEEARTELEQTLQSAWDALPDSLFESLIESMPRRIQALLDAKGWHTKY